MGFSKSILSGIAAVAMFSGASVFAQGAGSEPRLVLKGHDPVAYFTDSKPVKGNPKMSYDWDEGRYYFASAKNRDTFAANPERYAPQFGGYCTGSMAKGVRNEGHPEGWTISNGKLYVFGAPDSATAVGHKEYAERNAAAFTAKVAVATRNWREKK